MGVIMAPMPVGVKPQGVWTMKLSYSQLAQLKVTADRSKERLRKEEGEDAWRAVKLGKAMSTSFVSSVLYSLQSGEVPCRCCQVLLFLGWLCRVLVCLLGVTGS